MSKISNFSSSQILNIQKDFLLCLEGDPQCDLYLIDQGKLLIFVMKGSEVIPLAYLGKGEFLGELSFFDKRPRSAHVIAVEETRLIKISENELEKQFPRWLITMAKALTHRIRLTDEVIKKHGAKKKGAKSIDPLPLDQQRHYFKILKNAQS